MVRWILGLLLIAHGWVHLVMWVVPLPGSDSGAPFDARHSWLVSGLLGGDAARLLSLVLAALAGVGFLAGGIGLLAHQEWWRPLVVGAAAVSLVLIALYFHPWLSLGLGLEVAILVALLWVNWPPRAVIGV